MSVSVPGRLRSLSLAVSVRGRGNGSLGVTLAGGGKLALPLR